MKTNFDLGFSSALVLRTPAYSYEDYKSGEIPLHDPYFRTAILIATPSFYSQLAKKQFNLEKLSDKEKLTLLKYFNRMCYRSTPFGLFSCTGGLQWSSQPSPIIIKERQLNTLLSFSQTDHLANSLINKLPSNYVTYIANPSLYLIHQDYRYIWIENDPIDYKRKFFINAIENNDLLHNVLAFCSVPQTVDAIVTCISEGTDLSIQEAVEYANGLIAEQILLNTLRPNVTGEDYLSRLCGLTKDQPEDEAIHTIKLLQYGLSQTAKSPEIDCLAQLHIHKNNPLFQQDGKSPFYVNAGVEIAGTLNQAFQEQILEGIKGLQMLSQEPTKQALAYFAEAFRKKFDRRMVLLMEALDPETGVAYQQLGTGTFTPWLLEKVNLIPVQKDTYNFKWSAAHQMLLNKLMEVRDGHQQAIHLKDADLINLPVKNSRRQMPPSFFTMFRLTEKEIFIEHAGGSTATALLGRFTPISKTIDSLVKEIVAHEEQYNPDVIIAELVYLGELHIANVDRRKTSRKYEILVMTTAGVNTEYQLHLNELAVFAQGDEIWLWSLKHQKRVIPKMSSAYNANRSDLAVFRFLADLQHQGVQASLNFSLPDFIPGLHYYPRVQFKSTILSLATWIVPLNKLKELHKDHSVDQAGALMQLCQQIQLSGMVSLTENDHQLVFDLDNYQDIVALSSILKGFKEQAIFKEFPFAPHEKSDILNHKCKKHTGQFITALYNCEMVYTAPDMRMFPAGTGEVKRSFMPGTEWFYFKIYCHPSRANELLIGEIALLIRSFGEQIKQWFFIRYFDTGFHIRVRIKMPADLVQVVVLRLSELFQPLLDSGIVSAFSTDSYQRELERYTEFLIDEVEQFFHESTELILANLMATGTQEDSYDYYQVAFSSVDLLSSIMFDTDDERERFFSKFHRQFLIEFKAEDFLSDQLKTTFRELRNAGCFNPLQLNYYQQDETLDLRYQAFKTSLLVIKNKIAQWGKSRKLVLIGDLVHMHLNRLFTDSPRQQETICYYCLSSYYHGLRSRHRSATNAG